jgi:hypothetical protein
MGTSTDHRTIAVRKEIHELAKKLAETEHRSISSVVGLALKARAAALKTTKYKES